MSSSRKPSCYHYHADPFRKTSGSSTGIVFMIYNVGSVAAAPTVPFATDMFGRRVGMMTGAIIIIIGTCVQ